MAWIQTNLIIMPTTAEQYISSIERSSKSEPELPKAVSNNVLFFEQRNKHRNRLFWFSMTTSTISLLFLAGLIFIQGYIRYKTNTNFEVISEDGLKVIAVSIFGQVFGVVYIIAKALWSNHEFDLIKSEKK